MLQKLRPQSGVNQQCRQLWATHPTQIKGRRNSGGPSLLCAPYKINGDVKGTARSCVNTRQRAAGHSPGCNKSVRRDHPGTELQMPGSFVRPRRKRSPQTESFPKATASCMGWRRRRRRKKDVLKTAGREEVLLDKLLQSTGDFKKQNKASAKCFGHILSQW